MRILVFGDTHIPSRAKELPPVLYEEIKKADLVLHMGDFTDLPFLKELQKAAGKKLKAVYGNIDSEEVIKALPETQLFEAAGKKIALYHGGDGPPWGIEGRIIRRLIEIYGDEKVKALDIIVFGHTHSAVSKKINDTLFFNPGSPTDVIFAPYRSYGITEIDEKTGKIKAQIIKL